MGHAPSGRAVSLPAAHATLIMMLRSIRMAHGLENSLSMACTSLRPRNVRSVSARIINNGVPHGHGWLCAERRTRPSKE